MKTRLKSILLGIPGFQSLCRQLTRHHVRALMYHRFSSADETNPQYPDPLVFKMQMNHLVQNHSLWHPDDHLAKLKGLNPAGVCPVVVTIDDGYGDFYQIAYPIFRELKIPAMLFLTTGFVEGSNWFWWDRLAFIFDTAKPISMVFSISDQNYSIDLHSSESRKSAWNQIADRCRFLAEKDKENVLSELAQLLVVAVPATPPPKYSAISWDQVTEMHSHGIHFGAHTVTHPILSRVPLDQARQEIRDSRQVLAEKLGEQTAWFCYPQGGPADFTPEVRDLVTEAGFIGCYVAYQDLENSGNPYTLSRYCCDRNMVEFKWTLCGAEHLILKLKHRLGRPTGPGEFYWAGSN